MEEQKQERRMGLRRFLEHSLIFFLILSGNILDLVDSVVGMSVDPFLILQAIVSEFRILGVALLAFIHIPYNNIKTKAFSFMFAIWAGIIILHNNFYDMHPHIMSHSLYLCYLLWLARIALIPHEKINKVEQYRLVSQYSPDQSGVSYNVLMPVNTFRGLLQILFNPFANPLYETRILVSRRKITGIVNKKFVQMSYSESFIKKLIRNGGKVQVCKSYSQSKVDSLLGKKLNLVFRNCKKLEM